MRHAPPPIGPYDDGPAEARPGQDSRPCGLGPGHGAAEFRARACTDCNQSAMLPAYLVLVTYELGLGPTRSKTEAWGLRLKQRLIASSSLLPDRVPPDLEVKLNRKLPRLLASIGSRRTS